MRAFLWTFEGFSQAFSALPPQYSSLISDQYNNISLEIIAVLEAQLPPQQNT
jgi:hypothetical protein